MDRSKRLQRALAIGLALLATVSIGRAADEAYPSRPITVVVPYPAGGAAKRAGVARAFYHSQRKM